MSPIYDLKSARRIVPTPVDFSESDTNDVVLPRVHIRASNTPPERKRTGSRIFTGSWGDNTLPRPFGYVPSNRRSFTTHRASEHEPSRFSTVMSASKRDGCLGVPEVGVLTSSFARGKYILGECPEGHSVLNARVTS